MGIKLSEQDFIDRLNKVHGDKYKYSGDFVNTNTKVKLFCQHCKEYFLIKPSKVFIGQGCPHCRAERISMTKQWTTTKFKEEVLRILGPDYEVLSEYHGQSSTVTLKHLSCGTIFSTKASNIINKHRGCPKCTKAHVKHSGFKYSQQEFEDKVREAGNGEYISLQPYINTKTKLLFKHLKCGSLFLMSPDKFFLGERCPYCQHSRGEDRIYTSLIKNPDYTVIPQYSFSDLHSCKSNKSKLRFDFAVFKNSKLMCLIEYDGEQHFRPVAFSGNQKKAIQNFKSAKENDLRKTNYCKEHNILLIRIPYYNFNQIETILEKELPK